MYLCANTVVLLIQIMLLIQVNGYETKKGRQDQLASPWKLKI